MATRWLMAAAMVLFATPVWACGGGIETDAEMLLLDNAELAARAEARLKRYGATAMEILAGNREALAAALKQAKPEDTPALVAQLAKLDAAMDRIGNAKYCSRSGLYWHTDINTALEAAKKSGKPILSLRMLGNLTDELSCANSRFFRTTLYSNTEVSAFLRKNFVLHWKSVRPVPVITVDFGDGRKLTRTVTGNSAHYILTPDGQVVDCLPGLYGPKAFLRQLTDMNSAAKGIYALPANDRAAAIANFHAIRLEALKLAWASDLRRAEQPEAPAATAPATPTVQGDEATRAANVVRQQLERFKNRLDADEGVVMEQREPLTQPNAQQADNPPLADKAGKVAVGKYVVERPLVAPAIRHAPQPVAEQPVAPPPAARAARVARGKALAETPLIAAVAPARIAPDDLADEQIWAKIATFHADDATLDQASLDLIRSQNPTAAQAGRLALTKMRAEDPLVRMVRAFQGSIALDTVTNEYRLHRKIHEWLANPANHLEVDALNERVYAQLFLTPSSDPWLGLAPADAYTALPAGGVAGK